VEDDAFNKMQMIMKHKVMTFTLDDILIWILQTNAARSSTNS